LAGASSNGAISQIRFCSARGNTDGYRVATERFNSTAPVITAETSFSSDPRLTGDSATTNRLRTVIDIDKGVGTGDGQVKVINPVNKSTQATLTLTGTLTALGPPPEEIGIGEATSEPFLFEGFATGMANAAQGEDGQLPAGKVSGNFIGLYVGSFYANDPSEFIVTLGNDLSGGSLSLSSQSVSSLSLADLPAAQAFLDRYAPGYSTQDVGSLGEGGGILNTALISNATSFFDCSNAEFDVPEA
jgi:hypothetical protein